MILFGKQCKRVNDIKYMCYASLDPPIDGYKTDCGWGCVIRNFQSALCNYMNFHEDQYVMNDLMQQEFSVHSILERGQVYGAKAGQFQKPSVVCRTIIDLAQGTPIQVRYMKEDQEDDNLQRNTQFPFMLMSIIRFGLVEIDSNFTDFIHDCLTETCSLGMVVGIKNTNLSLYVIGVRDKHLLYLDPHDYRECNESENYALRLGALDSKYTIADLDPNITFIFNITSLEQASETMSKFKTLRDHMVTFDNMCPDAIIRYHNEDDLCVFDQCDFKTR